MCPIWALIYNQWFYTNPAAKGYTHRPNIAYILNPCRHRISIIKKTKLFLLSLQMVPLSTTLLSHKKKPSAPSNRARKTKRKGREPDIITALADGGGGTEDGGWRRCKRQQKSVVVFTILIHACTQPLSSIHAPIFSPYFGASPFFMFLNL